MIRRPFPHFIDIHYSRADALRYFLKVCRVKDNARPWKVQAFGLLNTFMQSKVNLSGPKIPSRQAYLQRSHSTRNLLLILLAHTGLVISYLALSKSAGPALSLLLFAPLCLAHQKYLSEWIHEGAHFNVLMNHYWNDIATNLLVGIFMGNNIAKHRAGHFVHHRLTNYFQAEDPDTKLMSVKSRADLARQLALDLCGWSAGKMFLSGGTQASNGRQRQSQIPYLAFVALVHLSIIALLYFYASLLPYLTYYAVLLFAYPVMNRIRVYGQHVAISEDGKGTFSSNTSRTIDAGILDRFFLTSQLMMYHHEHHLHPHLPYRALRTICEPSDDPNRFCRSRLLPLTALWRGLK